MFDPVFYVAIAMIVAISAPLLIFFYFLHLKPRMERALPNEKYWGQWKIFLPQLGILNVGDVTEAHNYLQNLFTKTADNTMDSAERQLYVNLRDIITKKIHVFAQKVEGKKFLYYFIGNPLDPKNHMRETQNVRFGPDKDVFYIHTVHSCKSAGKTQDGFEQIAVKLGGKTSEFTNEEAKLLDNSMNAITYLATAAYSKEKMKFLEERNKILDSYVDKASAEANLKTSEAAEAKIAAGTAPLVTVTAPEGKGIRFPSGVRWFFSGWQAFMALVAFLVTPAIMTFANIQYQDQTTVAVGVAFATFVGYPFVKRVLGR